MKASQASSPEAGIFLWEHLFPSRLWTGKLIILCILLLGTKTTVKQTVTFARCPNLHKQNVFLSRDSPPYLWGFELSVLTTPSFPGRFTLLNLCAEGPRFSLLLPNTETSCISLFNYLPSKSPPHTPLHGTVTSWGSVSKVSWQQVFQQGGEVMGWDFI